MNYGVRTGAGEEEAEDMSFRMHCITALDNLSPTP